VSRAGGVRDGLEQDRPFVSLIVPLRNERDSIDECLESLTSQTYPHDRLEVIVVDGRSVDGTTEIVGAWSRKSPMVRMLDNPGQLMAEGLNIGIRTARGDVIGAVSGHSVPARDYVERAVAALRETGAWCVGARIERIATTPLQRAIARATASPFGVGDARHNYAQQAQWVETAFPGMWPRFVFDRIGMFDASLPSNEDNEFSYRIWQAGGSVWLDPSIVVRYCPRATLPELFSQYRKYALGKVRVFRKHPGAVRWRHLVPPFALAAALGTTVTAIFVRRARPWLSGAVSVYTTALLGAAARARRDGDDPSPLLIGAAFATLHLAYGVGMWEGVFRFAVDGLRRRIPTSERGDR
jgi:succinoglycan biosynthesis protein ExoA